MKERVLLLGNSDIVIYNFRLELVERLLKDGYEVHFAIPYGNRVEDLVNLGAEYHEIKIDRHGLNPFRDLNLLLEYGKLFKSLKPSVILGYTIKPNIYGALMAHVNKIPFIATITGLGTAVEKRGWLQQFTILLYKIAFAHIQRIFAQNEENLKFFMDHKIKPEKCILVAGSGVNTDRFQYSDVPECGDGINGEPVRFAFVSRIMKEKGVDLYLEAAETIKKKYPKTEFHICGFKEEEYKGRLDELNSSGIVKYHGMVKNISEFMGRIHCVVHPSYYPEGLSNVLLEACACGRPIITTERSGCREVVEDNGFLVPEENIDRLIAAIEKYIKLPLEEKRRLGANGRKLAETRFSRQYVVDEYMKEIHRGEKAYAKRSPAEK